MEGRASLYRHPLSFFCSQLFPLLFPQPKSSNRLTTCQQVILTPRKHLSSHHVFRGLRQLLRVLRKIPTRWWPAVVPAQQKKGTRSLCCRFGDLKEYEWPSPRSFVNHFSHLQNHLQNSLEIIPYVKYLSCSYCLRRNFINFMVKVKLCLAD